MAKGRLYFSPNLFAQNTAVGIPIVSAIPRKEISSTEFFLCIQKLMAESIPLNSGGCHQGRIKFKTVWFRGQRHTRYRLGIFRLAKALHPYLLIFAFLLWKEAVSSGNL